MAQFYDSKKNTVGSDLYSIQIYDKLLSFKNFTPKTEFIKCAMIETSNFEDVPEGLETQTLNGGLYAVFIYKGLPKDFSKMLWYILEE